jgi:hypothetical protein
MGQPPPHRESETLQAAPSPFESQDEELAIPGLPGPSPGGRRTARTLALAFLVGAALVAGGFGVRAWLAGPDAEPTADVAALTDDAREALARGAYDAPPEASVLGLTDRILALEPEHPEALRLREEAADALAARAREATERGDRDEARALYRRAMALRADDAALEAALAALDEPAAPPPEPGVRTRPAEVIEDREVTLVAVLEPDVDVGEREGPRFVLQRRRRRVGRSIPARLAEDGRTYEATHTVTRPGRYRLLFRIGRGADRIEREAELEVARDPDRPRRRRNPDPPPVTTQGSAWSPPSVAPAWSPTPVAAPPPQPPPEPATPDPPPPPAPWTGGGGVL